MNTAQQVIYRNLKHLAQDFNRLQAERDFLLSGVQARLDAVNAERADILAEANAQLDRLNALRVANGEEVLTLQQIRDSLSNVGPRGPRASQQ